MGEGDVEGRERAEEEEKSRLREGALSQVLSARTSTELEDGEVSATALAGAQ